MPDDNVKRDIALIRKNAQQKYVDALIKFCYRRVERNKLNLTGSNSFNQGKALMQNNLDIRHILRSLTQMLSIMPRKLETSKRE